MGTNIRAETLPHKLRGQVTHRGSAEEVKLHGFKLTHGLQVGLLSVWRAAASHRLRYLMWETQFGKGREAERERRGEHTNASPLGLHKIHLDFSESRFLSSVATVRWICNVQYNGYFSLKKCQFFSLNNHPAHPRWLPGTPPPPMPCWTGVPPTSLVIGPARLLADFDSLKPAVCQNTLVLLLPG